MALVTTTRRSIAALVAQLTSRGAIGVTSVGCGLGRLEALLAKHLEVAAVDTGTVADLCEAARSGDVNYKQVTREEPVIHVPPHHALLFCFPIRQIPHEEYAYSFGGDVIVTISDESCCPDPSTEIQGFEVVHKVPFPSPFLRPVMTTYVRRA